MTFENLELSNSLLKAVKAQGYEQPSPIQEKAIPEILRGKDVLASAQTGTGKTAAFTLPLLHLLQHDGGKRKRAIRALILTPTRELAAQVYDNIREYSAFTELRSTVIFGGVKQHRQVEALKRGVDILVATPGRLLDLRQQGLLSLDQVELFVLDEADRMLDMGFLNDIRKVVKSLPGQRQNLMFSATYAKEIRELAQSFMNAPVRIDTAPQNSTAKKVEQHVYRVAKEKKTGLLIQLMQEHQEEQTLVFTRTKHRANKISKKLNQAGITAAAIHGDKSQNARTKALADFKKGQVTVLVATDIAARGLDIPLLPYVINYEIPNVAEDYVHRIGRTGRAGAAGEALSLVSADEVSYLKDIQKLVNIQFDPIVVPGFEPDPNAPQSPPSRSGKNTSRKKSAGRNRNRGGRRN